jgi:hypothetical protein
MAQIQADTITDTAGTNGPSFTFGSKKHQIRLDTSNGSGSSSTAIRRFANTIENVGTAISYPGDSATLGAVFTVNEAGIYAISYTDNYDLNGVMCISKNQSALTSNGLALAAAEVLGLFQIPTANHTFTVSWCGFLSVGDVIRPCCGVGTTVGTAARTRFSISKVL